MIMMPQQFNDQGALTRLVNARRAEKRAEEAQRRAEASDPTLYTPRNGARKLSPHGRNALRGPELPLHLCGSR